MANDLTPKQEAFARAYIETGGATAAYRQVYDCSRQKLETINRNAFKLAKENTKIIARINELQGILQKKHEVTVQSITRELEEDRQLARDLGQPAAAVSALNVKARIHGLDKQVLAQDPDNPLPSQINVIIVDKP